jgi:tetratricopeptide (TPR) repeat protein
VKGAGIKTISLVLLLAFCALCPLGALDLRAIDEHLEYLDRPKETYSRELPRVDPETYVTSLIAVIATLETALESEPNNPEILLRLGNAYRVSAYFPIEKVLRSWEDDPNKEFNLPSSYKRMTTGIEYLEKASKIAARNPEIYVTLGRAFAHYNKQEELQKGVDYLEKARQLESRSVSPFTLKWLAYMYLKTNQPERAFDTVREFLSKYPADWEIFQPYMRAGFSELYRNSERFPKRHSLIFLPADYDPNKRYPVLVDLFGLYTMFGYPWPGRPVSLKSHDPEAARKLPLDPTFKPERSLIILIPMDFDKGQDFRTWEGFSSLIETCEQRVLSDLNKIEKWYGGVDTSRVGLCGFSIGADLSWALSNRHPNVFCGAVVHGSRCGYIDIAKIPELVRTNSRYYFTIAADDLPARVNGMENAKMLLDEAGVENVYIKQKRGGHNVKLLDLKAAVDYLFFE